MKMPNFDDASWSSGEALLAIFFSQYDAVRKSPELRNAIRKQLSTALDVDTKNPSKSQVASELDDTLDMLIKIIRDSPYKIDSDSTFAPMIWLKIGMELSCTDLPISSKFQDSYCEWREDYLEKNLVVQIRRANRRRIGVRKKLKNRPRYSLDLFLIRDLSELIQYNWNTQYAKSKIETLKFSSLKNIKTRPVRDVRQTVGPLVFLKFESYINKAVKSGSIKLGKKIDNRYTYKGTRHDLLDALKKQFPSKLNNKDNSYLKIISATVACGKRNS